MITRQALELLQKTAQQADGLKSYTLGKHRALVFLGNGEIKCVEQDPNPIARQLETLDSFVAYVDKRKGLMVQAVTSGEGDNIAGESSVVFLTEKGVRYIEEPTTPYGLQASLDFIPSAVYSWLQREASRFYSQLDFCRVLRITLRDALPPGNLLEMVREIKFSNGVVGQGSVQQGRQSLSREIVNEVKGLTALPEEVILQVQPFDNVPYKAHVACALEIDETAAAFRLTPYPMQVYKCVQAALEQCQQAFDSIVPCYLGKAS